MKVHVELFQGGKWVPFRPQKKSKLIFRSNVWMLMDGTSDGDAVLFAGDELIDFFEDGDGQDYYFQMQIGSMENNSEMILEFDQEAIAVLKDTIEKKNTYNFIVGPYVPEKKETENIIQSKGSGILYIVGAAALLGAVYLAGRK